MTARTRRIAASVASLALTGLALFAVPASATFHLMSIREVYPGSAAYPIEEYVELQMYASGQNFVGGHVLRTYNSAGAVEQANVLGSDVASGANQSTILIATPEAESRFGVTADEVLSPGQLDPAGGAVCWEAIDCVSWGSFNGSLPSPAGSPAAPGGIPDGMAIRRTIAPGCPTLLEPTDDTNDSATDFSDAFPAPRPNAVAPSEHTCSAQSPTGASNPLPGAGGGSATQRLQTTIRQGPSRVTRDRTPTFRFTSNRARSYFLCKLDRGRFRRCRSPFTVRRLRPGPYVFRVKARTPGGPADRSPATWRFRVMSSGSARN